MSNGWFKRRKTALAQPLTSSVAPGKVLSLSTSVSVTVYLPQDIFKDYMKQLTESI